jgi:hypothetical protein
MSALCSSNSKSGPLSVPESAARLERVSGVSKCSIRNFQFVSKCLKESTSDRYDHETSDDLLSVLAMVPPGDAAEAFDLVADNMPQHEKVHEMLPYFEHTYLRARR